MADFFISYASADRGWAEWIGYVLEENDFDVIIQAWDFRPGSNFVLEMQKAAAEAERTIMVLSPDYVKSRFTSPEWAAAFAQDPQGLARKLLPIMVRHCSPPGLLAPLVHISLVAQDEETARDLVLNGVNAKRTKPSKRPSFPGSTSKPAAKVYPGSAPYIPKLKRPATDAEKRRFNRDALNAIKEHFEAGLNQLAAQDGAIECDFQLNTANDFTAEVFVNGKTRCRCRIWLGGLVSSDSISYAEGNTIHGTNATNEILSIRDRDGELHLESLMGSMSFGRAGQEFDLTNMTPDQAADCLWRRFLLPLER